jgi:hypothetical protein
VSVPVAGANVHPSPLNISTMSKPLNCETAIYAAREPCGTYIVVSA